ncbi:hypothetical protein GOODEAATRI_029701 [Goodea atripinnis]|uniref:Uncharacterized protein n=1 Tax=Goodea atripinnis TaxID=208336 RepID=A0ABV0NES0_9TELE
MTRWILFHSFIFFTAYFIECHKGAGAYLQQSMGERQGRPWTGHQSITGQHRDIQDKQPRTHLFTPKGKLEKPIYITVMFLDCGRKPENPCMHEENMQTPCRKTPSQESDPGPSCCKATVLPTVPPCSQFYSVLCE